MKNEHSIIVGVHKAGHRKEIKPKRFKGAYVIFEPTIECVEITEKIHYTALRSSMKLKLMYRAKCDPEPRNTRKHAQRCDALCANHE